MPQQKDVSGSAALAICESLLLALNDHKVLPEKEILNILTDAANANGPVAGNEVASMHNRDVKALINGIIGGGNSVRRP